MCRFVRSPDLQADQVSLEIEAAGGKLMGRLTPPDGAPRMIFLDHVPLLRAVKMAKLMADLLDADVIVVDPLGIWHEWLVEWACTPFGEAEEKDRPPYGHLGVRVGVGLGAAVHAAM
jgi:hypothetical protein